LLEKLAIKKREPSIGFATSFVRRFASVNVRMVADVGTGENDTEMYAHEPS
jgi:hypothetical protein